MTNDEKRGNRNGNRGTSFFVKLTDSTKD